MKVEVVALTSFWAGSSATQYESVVSGAVIPARARELVQGRSTLDARPDKLFSLLLITVKYKSVKLSVLGVVS